MSMINKIPQTFKDFRKQISEVLELANAPKDMISELADIDYDGVGLSDVVVPYWDHITTSLRNPSLQLESTNNNLLHLFRSDLYDMMLELVKEYNNPLNYSAKRSVKRLNDVELANKVMNIWEHSTSNKKNNTPLISESTKKLIESKSQKKDTIKSITNEFKLAVKRQKNDENILDNFFVENSDLVRKCRKFGITKEMMVEEIITQLENM